MWVPQSLFSPCFFLFLSISPVLLSASVNWIIIITPSDELLPLFFVYLFFCFCCLNFAEERMLLLLRCAALRFASCFTPLVTMCFCVWIVFFFSAMLLARMCWRRRRSRGEKPWQIRTEWTRPRDNDFLFCLWVCNEYMHFLFCFC